MKKWILITIAVIAVILLIFLVQLLESKSEVERKVEKIEQGFKGVVEKKYSVRDNYDSHLDIRMGDSLITISPYNAIVENAQIGDSIIKIKNENFITLLKKNGDEKQFFYTKLSYKTRRSRYFPKEWKDKWMESSNWDIENR